jgi:hypothetical protein
MGRVSAANVNVGGWGTRSVCSATKVGRVRRRESLVSRETSLFSPCLRGKGGSCEGGSASDPARLLSPANLHRLPIGRADRQPAPQELCRVANKASFLTPPYQWGMSAMQENSRASIPEGLPSCRWAAFALRTTSPHRISAGGPWGVRVTRGLSGTASRWSSSAS